MESPRLGLRRALRLVENEVRNERTGVLRIIAVMSSGRGALIDRFIELELRSRCIREAQ